MIEDSELKRYEQFLLECKNKPRKKREILSNGGLEYAFVFYKVLFESAIKEIKIFCKNCSSGIWNNINFQTLVAKFVSNSNVSLKILTVDNPDIDNKFLLASNVEIYKIDNASKDAIYKHFRVSDCNFIIVDDSYYRIEFNTIKYKAYGCFNDLDTARTLSNLFDTAFSEAKSKYYLNNIYPYISYTITR